MPGFDSPLARWFFRELFRKDRLAHHPTCSCYDNHLLRFGHVVFCLGCFCLVSGAIVSVSLLVFLGGTLPFHSEAGPWQMIGLGLTLFSPTLVQPFVQVKPFKVISRFLLGVSIVLLWYVGLFLLPWTPFGLFLRLVFVVVFILTFRATNKWRSRKTADPCKRCPFGVYPFCKGNQVKVNALITELERRACPEDRATASAYQTCVSDRTSVRKAVLAMHETILPRRLSLAG